jgi:CBS domain-containing protein
MSDIIVSTPVSALPARPVARVEVDDAMWKVVAELKAKGRGAAVVEDHGVLVGIFTERDLISRLDHTDILWSHVPVRDVMTPMPTVVRPSDTVGEAMRRLLAGKRRHLPIVDDAGRAVGLLSIRDLLAFVAGKFPEEMINLPPAPHHEA